MYSMVFSALRQGARKKHQPLLYFTGHNFPLDPICQDLALAVWGLITGEVAGILCVRYIHTLQTAGGE